MRVLLVADLEDWILGEIARRLADRLGGAIRVTNVVTHSPDFPLRFSELQRRHDVVHFLSPWDYFEYGEQTRRPCVATLWHMVDWTPFDKHAQRMDALCLASAQWQQRSATHIPAHIQAHRLRFGLDTQRFSRQEGAKASLRQQLKLPKDAITIGLAGSGWSNEGERKGLDRLWKCLQRLHEETSLKFVLLIVGRAWPSEMIPDDLKPFVNLQPMIDSAQLPEFYSGLDYYVCTSRQEGVPYPVLEAMSCECTVLSTAVGVVPEVIDHGRNGFVLPELNIDLAFVEIILTTALDPQFRQVCGQQAREAVVRSFSWEAVLDHQQYLDLYVDAIRVYQARPLSQRVGYWAKSEGMQIRATMRYVRRKLNLRSRLRAIIRRTMRAE